MTNYLLSPDRGDLGTGALHLLDWFHFLPFHDTWYTFFKHLQDKRVKTLVKEKLKSDPVK